MILKYDDFDEYTVTTVRVVAPAPGLKPGVQIKHADPKPAEL